MTLYFLFLFLVPFQHHPVLGAQLFHVGSFPMTPIKLVGIPLVAAAMLLPRPRDAAPRPSAGILLLFAAFALFQVARDHLVFLELSGHRCIDPVFLRDPDVRDESSHQHSTQIANDYSRDRAGRNVCQHVAVQAVLHLYIGRGRLALRRIPIMRRSRWS